jgi:hypothetical protein
MKPDTFTITTFWLDWLLMPLLLAGAWLTARWALADSEQASHLKEGERSFLPTWAYSAPLFVAAAAWAIAGLGTLIKEDYWEMRVILAAFALWTLCCFVGAVILFLNFLRKGRDFGIAGILNLVGLALISLLLVLPGLMDHSSPANVTLIGHVWFLLLAVSVALLTVGTLLGFPFRFPRFPLGLGVLFLIGWGLSEIAFSQASFPWLIRIWKFRLGLEYLDAFPLSPAWQVAGAVKVVVGIGTVAILAIVSFRQKARDSSHNVQGSI